MTWEDFAAPEKKQLEALQINSVWQIRAGTEYDIRRSPHNDSAWKGFFVVRTLGGEGRFFLADKTEVPAGRDTVLLLDSKTIQRYKTIGKSWYFWIFECLRVEPMIFRHAEPREISVEAGEEQAMLKILKGLKPGTEVSACLASARFGELYYSWAERLDSGAKKTYADEISENALRLMRARIKENRSVEWFASELGLSVRHFRRLFMESAGENPKSFYTRMRLRHAEEMLRFGMKNVGEAAAETGFGDQFHFSKAFKKLFGAPPSRAGRRAFSLNNPGGGAQR
jgi:AraC-like DNA-binding protein